MTDVTNVPANPRPPVAESADLRKKTPPAQISPEQLIELFLNLSTSIRSVMQLIADAVSAQTEKVDRVTDASTRLNALKQTLSGEEGLKLDDSKIKKEVEYIYKVLHDDVTPVAQMPTGGKKMDIKFIDGWVQSFQNAQQKFSTESSQLSAQSTTAQQNDSTVLQNASAVVATITKSGVAVAQNVK